MPADRFEERLRAGLDRLASEARVSPDARERLHRRAQREPIRRMGVVVASYAMVVIAAAALIVGTRWSRDDRGSAVVPGPTATTVGASTTTTTTRAPAGSSGGSAAGPGSAPTTDRTSVLPPLGPGYSTGPRRAEHTPEPLPPLPRIVRLDAGRHDDEGFDRVVIEFDRGLAGYDISYVAQVVQDGTGDPAPLLGSDDLQIRITPADAHDDAGRGTLPVSRLTPGFKVIQEVRLVSDFEGYVTIGVGVAGRQPFKVSELSGPSRLVIDFAHPR